VLSGVPGDVDTLVFPNYESLPERDDVRHPFLEVTLFKKNYAHVLSGGWGGGVLCLRGRCCVWRWWFLAMATALCRLLWVGGRLGYVVGGSGGAAQKQEVDGATGVTVVLTRPAPVPQTCTSSRTAWWRAATPTTSLPTATANRVSALFLIVSHF
jgi:hypothetical protein